MSSSGNQLEGGLKSRHLTMLSIAGVIGGALFVGSGKSSPMQALQPFWLIWAVVFWWCW